MWVCVGACVCALVDVCGWLALHQPTGGASTARSRVLKTGVSFVKKRAPSLDSGAVIPPDADKTPTPRTGALPQAQDLLVLCRGIVGEVGGW